MNPYTMTALVLLALVATASFFYGTKKNKWLSSSMTKDFEDVLKPTVSNYVNIGGSIGYNFVYSLPQPYASAKGTITLSPRHSILYLPVSLLIGIRDRYYVNIFTKRKVRGEAHLIERSYLKKAKIEGIENMERKEISGGAKNFVMLWRGADLSAQLEAMLGALPDPTALRHFCAYPETKTFFLHGLPRNGRVKDNLEAAIKRFPDFLAKEKD